jgi:hypothetical protein
MDQATLQLIEEQGRRMGRLEDWVGDLDTKVDTLGELPKHVEMLTNLSYKVIALVTSATVVIVASAVAVILFGGRP